jgi:leukotriene-A4 hydrolase
MGGLVLAMVFSACSRDDYDPTHDSFSFANSDQFVTGHLELDLKVDFDRQTLDGNVILHMKQLDPAATTIVLDSRGLQIRGIQLATAKPDFNPVEFDLSESDAVKGEAIRVHLPADFQPQEEILLKIDYQTGPDASALMWLPPELTAGGDFPFLFTQSQSIHARSWVPLQDTPAVRFTYEAIIQTPPQLRALMSANNDPQAKRSGEYHFSMPQPIPSYLLALAVGHVFFEPIGQDTGVYAEPVLLREAAWEFGDTQAMLDAADALYGPYLWSRYDLLILPPSFPYGGMENPRLSFITPSIIAGDRSLVSMIAHELAHSWSGNLVSNATWRDIWLNEGTTSYLDARLMEVLYGKERADEERLLTYQNLLEQLQTVPAQMQHLAPVFQFEDPDIGQDGLEYSKGQLLLETLEAAFGRDTFDEYLAGYFEHFKFKAINSEQFLEYIDSNLLQKFPGRYSREEIEQWLYQPGIPDSAVVPASPGLQAAASMAVSWSKGEQAVDKLPVDEWSPLAMVAFIKALPSELTARQLQEIDQTLGLSTAQNSEIARTWFIQAASRQYRPAYDDMRSYLNRYGRTRLVKPVYKALFENGEDSALARALFDEARVGYHPLTIAAILPILQDAPE